MRGLFSTFLAVSLASLAMAQGPNDPDPPSRAARLSYLNGSVSFQPGGVEDWVPAEPNRPLTTGDRLWTDNNSRVEMNLGSAAFRLSGRTNFTFLNLDDRIAQVQLSAGTMSIRLRHLADDETVEIDTPQVAFTLLRAGEYRIEVSEGGDATIVTVRGGDGEATANGQAFAVHAREQVRISGYSGADPNFDRRNAPPSDSFDLFCQDRDRREDMSPSARYVSRDMPGYADLDANGTWGNDPDYGSVWVPSRMPADWSPYHYGHWAWIAPWGWTWVDDAAWGYAPFHYGRWAVIRGTWGWIPGPVAVRPVYAPAMVAFVGGGGFSAAISIGGGGAAVGWFPLGPREVWVPSYRVSQGYMTRVNVSNTVVTEVNVRNVYTNVYVNRTVVNNNVYVNQRVPGAMIAVRGDAMVSGRSIGAAAVRVPPNAVVNVAVMHAAPVAPERAAVLGGRTPMEGGARMPPPAFMNRQVVANAAPPPAPLPFVRQQEALRANPGRPLDSGAVRNLQSSQPAPSTNFRPSAPSAPAARVAPVNGNPVNPGNGNPGNRDRNGGRPSPNPEPPIAPRPENVNPIPNGAPSAPDRRFDRVRPDPNAPRPNQEMRTDPAAPRPNPVPRPEVQPQVVNPVPNPTPVAPDRRLDRVRPDPNAPRPNQEMRTEPVAPRPNPLPQPEVRPQVVNPAPNPTPAAPDRRFDRVRPDPNAPPPNPNPVPRQEVRPENPRAVLPPTPEGKPEAKPNPPVPTPADGKGQRTGKRTDRPDKRTDKPDKEKQP